MFSNERIITEIKKLLSEHNLTQKQFAESIHVTPQAVSKWTTGKGIPSSDNIMLIHETYGIDLISKCAIERKPEIMEDKIILIDNFLNMASQDAVKKILSAADFSGHYSFPVERLMRWCLSAVAGLSLHELHKPNYDEMTFAEIFIYNLEGYTDVDIERKCSGSYENRLEFEFYLMGGDLFESFGEYKMKDHEICDNAMTVWERFMRSIKKSPASQVYNEFLVALSDIICFFTEEDMDIIPTPAG